jgi:hypothetical protein
MAIAIDPDWARRRYEQALTERKVVGYRNADGSANLSGYNLPVERVAAAGGHIDALAKAAKHAGDDPSPPHRRTHPLGGLPGDRGTADHRDHPARARQRARHSGRLGTSDHPISPTSTPARAAPQPRIPGAALRRGVEIRDRYCIMIGCRAPACTADQDHTRDHGQGGSTTESNPAKVPPASAGWVPAGPLGAGTGDLRSNQQPGPELRARC